MKSTSIVTRYGKFKIIIAAKGRRGATRAETAHALAIARNRIERSERRQGVLKTRRDNLARKTRRGTR